MTDSAASPTSPPPEPAYDFAGLGFRTGAYAVVSGAGNGIGRSAANILARSGVNVLAWDVDEAALERLVTSNAGASGRIVPQKVDATDADAIAAAWQATASLDVRYLANNAGPPNSSSFGVAEGIYRAVGGYVAMTEGFLAHHADHAESMVLTASTAGNFMVAPTPDWYPTAKAGVVGYTRHLAVKLGGKPRANAVAPGATVTARTSDVFATPAFAEKLAKYPMGRAAWSWEVATLICFLLSPAASFINGVLVPVDGASTWKQ